MHHHHALQRMQQLVLAVRVGRNFPARGVVGGAARDQGVAAFDLGELLRMGGGAGRVQHVRFANVVAQMAQDRL
ncbi:hypothetical protein D3C71_1597290 [compost metagenome]